MYEVTITAPSALLNNVHGAMCSQWQEEDINHRAFVKRLCTDVKTVKGLKKKPLGSKEASSKNSNSCKSTSTLKPQALCPFSPELWNLGATCISNHVHKAPHPQCPYAADKNLIESIKKKCRKAKLSDEHKCSRLAMSY